MRMVLAAAVFAITPSPIAAASPATAKDLTPAEITTIRGAITDQVANYALLVDGDGLGRDPRKWADMLWTEDAVFQTFDADGRSIFGNPVGLTGREQIYTTFAPAMRDDHNLRVRHLFLDIRFDRIEPSHVEQSMVGYIVRGWHTAPSSAVDATDLAPSSYVYHNEWRRGDDGVWRLDRSTVYCAFNCLASPKAK